jgi:hypothetical protein
MDWTMFNDEPEESGHFVTGDQYLTPAEYLEQHEYYQQFHPQWDDTLLWIMMLPEEGV